MFSITCALTPTIINSGSLCITHPYFQAFFFFSKLSLCSIIGNKSNYLNKITPEAVKLAIAITNSNISRGLSPLGIINKVYQNLNGGHLGFH